MREILPNIVLWIVLIVSILLFLIFIFSKEKEEKEEYPDAYQIMKNVMHIHQIINGHYEKIPTKKKYLLLELSQQWFAKKKHELYEESSPATKKRLRKMMKRNEMYDCPVILEDEQARGLDSYLSDLFTEPFPSSYDMPEFYLRAKFTELLVLKGIDNEGSKKFGIHIKNNLVNHTMKRGVIHFDIVYV